MREDKQFKLSGRSNMKIGKVGVVGCGLMGSGITQACAQAGYPVLVSDLTNEILNKGLASIKSTLTKEVDKNKMSSQEKDAILARIKTATNNTSFIDCDLVIEAVTEDMKIKKQVFAELDKTCPKHTVLATNTSTLSIIDLAMQTSRPDKVLGMHFFNPAPVMKLLESVKTIATSEESILISKSFGESIGKTVVIAQDTPGFIVNRLLTPFMLNAIRMLESGLASRDDIDNAITLGLNHPIGPLRLVDMIGIDNILAGSTSIYDKCKDPQYAPPILLEKMYTAGHLGRKAGKGFYEYKK
jgi:3-hydroxybutyryl-CoA dehydrogenase